MYQFLVAQFAEWISPPGQERPPETHCRGRLVAVPSERRKAVRTGQREGDRGKPLPYTSRGTHSAIRKFASGKMCTAPGINGFNARLLSASIPIRPSG